MNTIKIRYIKRNETYYMERKTIFGWRRVGRNVCTEFGCIWQSYISNNKEDLLSKVLEYHYKIDKRFVEIIEYPMIKIY